MLAFQHREVYYPYMPSIVGKRRGKQTYYYLVESARVDGKPRIVSQEYLGTAEEVMARLQGSGAGEPDRSQHKAFGDVAAVWGMLKRLQVPNDVIDDVGDPQPGGRSVLQARVRRLVGNDGRAAAGARCRGGVGPPSLLGRHGHRGTRRPGGDPTAHHRPRGHRVWAGPVRDGARHDQLRHVYRLGQSARADRPARQGQAETHRFWGAPGTTDR